MSYDALYRLIEATGREHFGQIGHHSSGRPKAATATRSIAMGASHHPGNGDAMGNYGERYDYDAVGNFDRPAIEAASGNWTRTLRV